VLDAAEIWAENMSYNTRFEQQRELEKTQMKVCTSTFVILFTVCFLFYLLALWIRKYIASLSSEKARPLMVISSKFLTEKIFRKIQTTMTFAHSRQG